MRKFIILLPYLCSSFICVGTLSADPINTAPAGHEKSMIVSDTEWDAFKSKYNKKYKTKEEDTYRREIYRLNKLKVQKLNFAQVLITGEDVFGVTKFSDLKESEFAKFYLTPKMTEFLPNDIEPASLPLSVTDAPTNFTWISQGAITPVKNQKKCGSCWAFSATEMVESMAFIKTKTLPILAPQQLVSCDTNDNGCGGGWPSNAFKYLTTYGQEQEKDYRYKAKNGTCTYNAAKVKANITGWKYVIPKCFFFSSCTSQNSYEPALKTYTANSGPASIAVDASSWQFYNGGILASSCSSSFRELNHAVQLVGYGKSGKNSYWTVRNSWGSNWGEKGYIRLIMGKNMCGLANVVTTPTGASVK